MRIGYIAALRLPSERAYGHQVARVCDALVANGHQVTILCPDRDNPIREDFWEYHRARREIGMHKLPAFDGIASPFTPGVIGLKLHTWSFIRLLRRELTADRFDVLYTRTPALLSALLRSGIPTVMELHTLPRFGRGGFAALLRRCKKVVCLTTPMRNELLRWGVPEEVLCVEPDGVDLAPFAALPDGGAARRQWGISETDQVLGYAGSLHTMGLSKGVEVIVEAVALLRADYPHIKALIAGGPQSSVEALHRLAEERGVSDALVFLGAVPHATVPAVYAASDILVYPAPASMHPYFQRDTSPLKLLEYMAVGKPIICADLPPVHDLLSGDTADFFKPGDAHSLALATAGVLSHPTHADHVAKRAAMHVQHFLWTERMERILPHT